MKILHVAPINVAGVPYSMMDMQRRFGHHARLVTLHTNSLTFTEDICLSLPLPRHTPARIWRHFKRQSNPASEAEKDRPPVLKPRNVLERGYFEFDDWRRSTVVTRAFQEHNLDEFEIIHFDGGLDFYRDARVAKRWKHEGKKIVCHYMGSDLRVRGVHPVMDELSDLNLTNESDHLRLHPNIHYIFIPFEASAYAVRTNDNDRLRIIHSPSNRAMKGTRFILPVIEKLKQVRDIEFLLVEGAPHEEVVRIKQTCDIAIEQVGNLGGTGYGRNSLETLAMGIPTITEMTPDYLAWLPENPFVLASPATLVDRLIELIDDPDLRKQKGTEGRAWVERYHSYDSVNHRLMDLYRDHGIL
ncbi:MAG: glycosyltransferase [Ignavibacteriales bacterium]|nr:glycosyltransferase [Ignavibacteriales bacterium]